MDHAERVQVTAQLSGLFQRIAKTITQERSVDEVLVASAMMHAGTQLLIDNAPALEVADWLESQGRELRAHAPMLAPTGGTA